MICGLGNPPLYEEQLDVMHYLTAVIYETARLAPVQPFLRRCSLNHGDFLFALSLGIFIKFPKFERIS